ncbi:hypothetical protein TI39_contig353g00014 [Zymoseptoria brevis]|uniref:Uncharacterized protein n=1 Tax=Zymoseptoria brevis TaxID=1047168 RepID=A0A0F4GRM7_9PEZI|nr:hypothetical protein TI39_contig353g00014 [Zymoseptoria brevis]
MSLLNVLRQRASCTRTPLAGAPLTFTRNVVPQLIRGPRWTASLNAPGLSRLSSSVAKHNAPPKLRLREYINIFHAGSPAISAIGLIRITGIIIAAVGCIPYPIMFYMSPNHSNWWIPALILASPIPLLLMLFTTGPFIHSIQVKLPASARTSKEALKAFAERPNADTILRFHYMKLWPWPTSKEIPFGRLRRIKPSLKAGWANLEWVSEQAAEHRKYQDKWWYEMAQGVFKRKYYVNRDQKTDRGAVPGVWNEMWKQIPMKGSRGDPMVAARSRRPVTLSGRPGKKL